MKESREIAPSEDDTERTGTKILEVVVVVIEEDVI